MLWGADSDDAGGGGGGQDDRLGGLAHQVVEHKARPGGIERRVTWPSTQGNEIRTRGNVTGHLVLNDGALWRGQPAMAQRSGPSATSW